MLAHVSEVLHEHISLVLVGLVDYGLPDLAVHRVPAMHN
jgi:hypothetical protein